MANNLVPQETSMFLSIDRFEFAKKVSAMLAASRMIPSHFRGADGVGNCMIALNLADRLKTDVFMLMQSLYVVHERPGLEAKMAIALFNDKTKLFVPPLRYEKAGDYPHGKDAKCRAYAVDKVTGETIYGEWITWDMVEAEGWNKDKPYRDGSGVQKAKWNTMPGQMFVYRAAAFFIRAYDPGILMGLQTKDELEDIIDVTPSEATTNKLTPQEQIAAQSLTEDIKSGKHGGTKNGEMYKGKDIPPATEPSVDPPQESEESRVYNLIMSSRGKTIEYVQEHWAVIEAMPGDKQAKIKERWAAKTDAPWPGDSASPEVDDRKAELLEQAKSIGGGFDHAESAVRDFIDNADKNENGFVATMPFFKLCEELSEKLPMGQFADIMENQEAMMVQPPDRERIAEALIRAWHDVKGKM